MINNYYLYYKLFKFIPHSLNVTFSKKQVNVSIFKNNYNQLPLVQENALTKNVKDSWQYYIYLFYLMCFM